MKLKLENMKELLNNTDILLYFRADWCAPCKVLAQSLSEVDLEGFHLVKVDHTLYPEITERFGVRGLPTIILYREGLEQKRHVGAMSTNQLKIFLEV